MGGGNIKVGNDFFSGNNLYISTSPHAAISIGDAVMFGPEVMVLGGNHDVAYDKGHLRFNDQEDVNAKNIVIENGVWVGARTVVLSGAHLGEGVVVGACSVVNKYIPPYCVAAGNHAKLIKPRFNSALKLDQCLKMTNSQYCLKDLMSIYGDFGIRLD